MGNHHSGANHSSPGPHLLKRIGSKQKIVIPDDYSTLCQALINRSKGDNVGENISRRVFVQYFNSRREGFGELVFEHAVGQQSGLDVHFITKQTFMKLGEQITELTTDSHRLKYFVNIFARNKDNIKRPAVEHFFMVGYYLASEVSVGAEVYDITVPAAKLFLDAAVSSVMKNSDSISTEAFCTWIKKNYPNLIAAIHHWVSTRVHPTSLENAVFCPNDQVLPFPSENGLLLNPFLLWLLSCSLPSIYTKRKQAIPSLQRMLSGQLDPHKYISQMANCINPQKWTPLYNSKIHGTSLNRFQNHVFSYRGSTVMLLELEEGVVFCVGVDKEWRESCNKWGDENCIVIQILPEYKIVEAGAKMIYTNIQTRGYPLGITVGQNAKHPVLEIEQEMVVVLVKKIPYKLLNIEVWGSAGEDILEAQHQQKAWESREVEKHRKVGANAVDWRNNPDKFLLELASSKTTGSYVSNS